MGLQSRTSSMY